MPAQPPVNVLYVENDRAIRQRTSGILRRAGLRVTEAANTDDHSSNSAQGWVPVALWGTMRKKGIPHAEAPESVLQSMVTLRIHLDDMTDEYGPLLVVPKMCEDFCRISSSRDR